MANEYCVVLSTSKGYMPGTNAFLNAAKYYGMDVDFYVLMFDDFLPENYKAQWENENVFFKIMDKTKDRKATWWCRFYDLIYAVKNLFSQYKVILFWGADVCLVNNIQDYFLISDRLNKVIVGTNEHGTQFLNKLSLEWPYKHHWHVPYTDVPLFIPQGRVNLIKKILEYQSRGDCTLSKMDGLNYAIKELKINPFIVPGELWVQNVPYRTELQKFNDKLFIKGSSTRLNSFHRKYWMNNLCRKYLAMNEMSRQNKLIFNQFYNFFNRECYVKWEGGLEIWDGK